MKLEESKFPLEPLEPAKVEETKVTIVPIEMAEDTIETSKAHDSVLFDTLESYDPVEYPYHELIEYPNPEPVE